MDHSENRTVEKLPENGRPIKTLKPTYLYPFDVGESGVSKYSKSTYFLPFYNQEL